MNRYIIMMLFSWVFFMLLLPMYMIYIELRPVYFLISEMIGFSLLIIFGALLLNSAQNEQKNNSKGQKKNNER